MLVVLWVLGVEDVGKNLRGSWLKEERKVVKKKKEKKSMRRKKDRLGSEKTMRTFCWELGKK